MNSPSDRPQPASPGQALLCPVCEAAGLVGRHCKRLCPGCGYVESCEDNFLPNQNNPAETGRCRLDDGERGHA
jgi:hypothetical protein